MKQIKKLIIDHGDISVEENHSLINNSLKEVCDRLNNLGVDYYIVGALSTFIGTQTPLFRYHGDIDFMVAEKDIPKVREALKDKVDKSKIAEMKKYKTTLRLVEPGEVQINEDDISQSAIQATEEKTRTSIINEQIMKIDEVKSLSKDLYDEVSKNGISVIRKLFSEGKTLSEKLRYDGNTEYLKKMIISQFNTDRMLLTHKYYNTSFDTIPTFRTESDGIRRKIENDTSLQFDEDTIQSLFGNSLDILTDEDYEEWKNFVYSDRRGDKNFDIIFLEEEFKFGYENETNSVKKFVKSFKYKKMQKGSYLEDSYVKKVREMMRKIIIENPDNTFTALVDTHNAIERGVAEHEGLKEIEDIVRMTLASLDVKTEEIIDIEAECKRLREEMKSDIGTTKIGTEYRQRQVTLGSETGISKRPVIQTIPFEQVPKAMQDLQEEYEEAYNTQNNPEEYIRKIAKIYADFIYLQPYEDGNKRTAICLFNSMLCSKGIVPPPISLTNDEEMIKAFYKVQEEKNYSMIQDVMLSRYKEMQGVSENNDKRTSQRMVLKNREDEEIVEL